MAKKALLDVLEHTIGKYVRNLDAESLNVAVWSGKIELSSLELDVAAVNAELDRQAAEAPNLAIPFRVRYGSFQKFQVDVPWAHLMSRPVVLRAQGLEVSVEPLDTNRTAVAAPLDQQLSAESSEAARRKIREQRKKSIQAADEFRLKSNALRKLAAVDVSSSSQKKESSTFATRLARRIIENIQMEISDVHITLVGGDNTAAGVVLESLQLVTTDQDGNRAFVDRTSGEQAFLHKALQISGLGIYLNEATSSTRHMLSIREEEAVGPERSYVLAPLSFEAKLRQADTNVCLDCPKYALVSELSGLSILLSRTQLEQMRRITDKIRPAHDMARPLFPEYRPLARVTPDTAVEWWRYAYRCIGRLNGRRSWLEFLRAFRARKEYISLYKRRAHQEGSSWLKPLAPDELIALDRIERDRSISVEGLMIWRSIADAQFEKEQEKHNANKQVGKTSLLSSLFGTPSKAQATTDGEEPPLSLSVEELKELELATMEQSSDAELSSDSKLCDIQFTLGSFRIHLTSYDMRQLASLDMGKVSASFDANVDGSFDFDFRLTSLEIHDKVTPDSLFPTVLKNQATQARDADSEAFGVRLGKSATGDQNLRVVLDAFEAVASPVLLVELNRFVSFHPLPTLSKPSKQNPILAQSLSGSVDLFYDATEGVRPPEIFSLRSQEEDTNFFRSRVAELSLTETKSALTIDLDLQAPILVLPENCVDPLANVLVFDLGHMRVRWNKGHEKIKQDGSVVLSSMTFLVGKANDVPRLAKKHDSGSILKSGEAVVEPMSVSVDIEVESQAANEAGNVVSLVVVQAEFSSLHVNWNPQVVKMIAAELEKFRERLFPTVSNDAALVVSSPTNRVLDGGSQAPGDGVRKFDASEIRFTAELERFQVSFNSAQDGLPLFVLAMSGAKVFRVSSGDGDTETSLVLDDVSISSPDMGRTHPMYRTVLGLSPGLNESLLTVKYYEGSGAAKHLPGDRSYDVEAFGEVELSPMRLVYIHSQILALVEYATAGILGALATQMATTAASAAAEIATAMTSPRIFSVKATNLEVVLPQAAYRSSSFSVCSGTMLVDYAAMADTSSSAQVRLSGFELRDPGGKSLQDGPIQMTVDVLLPPEDVGSSHDQAMRVSVVMPNAGFIIPKNEYAQLLATLNENIGELDLFLRDEGNGQSSADMLLPTDPSDREVQLTHAGTEFVDKPRRMYLRLEVGVMSLELASASLDDPIVRLAAVDASIKFETFPDERKTIKSVTLRNLNCDDQRVRASTRQYRSLIYQHGEEEAHSQEDVFTLTYETRDDLSQSIDISIGSSNVVFIPDAVADVLEYLDVQAATSSEMVDATAKCSEHRVKTPAASEHIDDSVKVDATGDGIEASFRAGEANKSSPLRVTTCCFKTSTCTLILVDLGSDPLLQSLSVGDSPQVTSVAETIVFRGTFEADIKLGANAGSGLVELLNCQMHGDELECYSAFGRDLESALQILEPTKLSVYVNMKRTRDQSRTLDVTVASMEPVDIMLSMRNVALVSAILNSTSTCFEEGPDGGESTFLDESEAKRIERLASALEKDDIDQSTHSQVSSISSFRGVPETVTTEPAMAISFRVTAPEALVTVINDLQGLDDPLFRIAIRNSVANARIREAPLGSSPSFTMFDFNTHMSVLADFFDQSTNAWKPLLSKVWELSTNGDRGPSQRSQSMRPNTTIDVECFPCYMCFSEQFLMGLASASQMWSVYSSATESAIVDAPESKQLRKSLAASAARKFVASLPYAIENHSGTVAKFVVGGDKAEQRVCESGSVKYFRFKPPPGRGCAGKRLYGQDVSFEKAVKVLIGSTTIAVRDIDRLPGTPLRSYMLGNDEIVMINVAREGKTIVSEGYCELGYQLIWI